VFNKQDFINCIEEQLARQGFGRKRAAEIVARFEGLSENYKLQGRAQPEVDAMLQVFNETALRTAERAKRAMNDLLKRGEVQQRFDQADDVITKLTAKGSQQNAATAIARAAISYVEHDPRFKGVNYDTERDNTRRRLWAIMADSIEKIGKGAFGTQKGKAHLSNTVREIFGEATGDMVAKEIAIAWRKTADAGVDLFNLAGGSLAKLKDWRLPQAQNSAKLIKAGFEDWRDFHMRSLDWSKMAWPDGSPIPAADRAKVLRAVFDTLQTGGANKIDPTAFNGRGAAVGNKLEEHRFLHYKDGSAWLEMHQRYGDGTVFDVMSKHVEDMSHRIALVQTFGSNPSHMADVIKAVALKKAAGLGGKAKSQVEAALKNKFDPMFEIITRTNPMDPESITGNLVTGAANLLTAAQLGAASLLAIPGDFATTTAVRFFNKMSPFGGVDFYFKTLATDRKFMREIATQSGFVFDEAVAAVYGAQRFTGIATVGPQLTRRVSDTVLRASLLSGHTTAARWSVQAEFMGLLARSAGTEFDKLPFKAVMERFGITAADWNAFRKLPVYNPRKDISFLRPLDALGKDNGEELYRKFQGMIFESSREMVPEGTIEGSAMLRGTTRPDTLIGALGYSFAMYKNFPVSMMMTYSRLAMTNEDRGGRLAFIGGLVASMTLMGALGVQMREVSKGRDPLPMDTPAFWGKALLSGGALSIWGDFLFGGINRFGGGPADTAAGPVVNFVGDTAQLAFGVPFEWAESLGNLDKDANWLGKAVDYARRYTPGTSLWFARLAVERYLFDSLAELADPKAYQRFRRRQQKQKRDSGNEYWWAPGELAPDRAPAF
jgi:hypothetical protein